MDMRCLRLDIKKIFGMLLLAAALALPSGAVAAEVTASVLPATMISEGEARITVTITNDNPVPSEGEEGTYIREIFVFSEAYPDMAFSGPDEIAPGESGSYTASYYINAMMLNQSIPATANYVEGDRARSENVSVKVQSVAASNVSITRSASSKQASPGEEITLTYTVKNSGQSPVTVTSIVDREIAGRDSFQQAFDLEPGGYLEIPYTYKMGRNTVESAPIVTYKDGFTGESQTATCSPITLGMVNSKISVEVIQGEATENGVAFTLNLTNNGNQRVSDIKITDELGNRVNDTSFALAVGETRQLTYTVKTEEERYVVFSITGDTSSGDYEDKTKSYVVRKFIDPSLLGIQFKANVTETLNSAGSIEVQFDVINAGTMTMTDLVISEVAQEIGEDGEVQEKLTEIFRTDSVAPGPFTTTQTIYVGEPRDMTFLVEMNDPAGNPYSYRAYISAEYLGVRDEMDAETAQQNVIDALGATIGDSINRALNISMKTLIILIGVSVVSMVVLTILEHQHRKEMARRRAVRERQARRPMEQGGAMSPERGYTQARQSRPAQPRPSSTQHRQPSSTPRNTAGMERRTYSAGREGAERRSPNPQRRPSDQDRRRP